MPRSLPFEPKNCLFHNKRKAYSYSGHYHANTPVGDIKIIVGLCKECRKWENHHDGISRYLVPDDCEGCYGFYTGD